MAEKDFVSKDGCYASVMQPWLASVTSLDVNSSASNPPSSSQGRAKIDDMLI